MLVIMARALLHDPLWLPLMAEAFAVHAGSSPTSSWSSSSGQLDTTSTSASALGRLLRGLVLFLLARKASQHGRVVVDAVQSVDERDDWKRATALAAVGLAVAAPGEAALFAVRSVLAEVVAPDCSMSTFGTGFHFDAPDCSISTFEDPR